MITPKKTIKYESATAGDYVTSGANIISFGFMLGGEGEGGGEMGGGESGGESNSGETSGSDKGTDQPKLDNTTAEKVNETTDNSQTTNNNGQHKSTSSNVEDPVASLKPEAKYLGSKKHGINWKEGPATAKSLNSPEGQWGSKADLDFAGQKAATLKPGESGTFELPSGSSSTVHLPNGTTVKATHFWIRNNGTGTFHGYPLVK